MTPSRLIVVAGHAVYLGTGPPEEDASWSLLPFQRGEPPAYLAHLRRGIELAANDPAALLVLSGGRTRREAGPRSEAEGYRRAAERSAWFGHAEVADRCATEEYARDSFENLLFALCRFRELVGRTPEHATVVSWAFKRERFGLHRLAIGLPSDAFAFEGPNDPEDLAAAVDGERRNALQPFATDPYGTARRRPDDPSDVVRLGDKRAARDPFRRHPPYARTCPELAALLTHAGPEPFAGELPWSRGGPTAD